MTLAEAGILFVVSTIAMAINAVVGSGSLLTFPTLLWLGFSPVTANMSNAIGLSLGGISAVFSYRERLRGHGRDVIRLAIPMVVGSAIGAGILMWLPERRFEAVVPYLVAAALVLVIAQPWLQRRMARRTAGAIAGEGAGAETQVPAQSGTVRPTQVAALSANGVYVGYFGAAQGVMLWGILSWMRPGDPQHINALKNAVGVSANIVSGIMFLLWAPDQVSWPAAGIIFLGAIVGGYAGGQLAQSMSHRVLRSVVIGVGFVALLSLIWRPV